MIMFSAGQKFYQEMANALPTICKNSSVPKKTTTNEEAEPCHKDLGEKQVLKKMSRGHFFVVRAGGHIETFTPLYE